MVRKSRRDASAHALRVVRPALELSSPLFLADILASLERQAVLRAVAVRDTAALFDWLLGVVQYQGISDASVDSFTDKHGLVGWSDIAPTMTQGKPCKRLTSYWHFAACGYRKAAQTCSEPDLLASCTLPTHPFRNGRLSQAAFSLFLFMRDVCDGDFVGWMDRRLELADRPGSQNRTAAMRRSILEPMANIHGVSNKVLSMAMSDLLLVADPRRERWVTTGANMIVVDTLVHNFLHRTGILRRFNAAHPYGTGCYAAGGCAEIIEGLARQIDARSFNPDFPSNFPRFLEHSIWQFCAAGQFNICNGNQIDDRGRCQNRYCPTYEGCERVSLRE